MFGTNGFQARFDEAVVAELAAQPLVAAPVLTEHELSGLPAPVQRFVRASGAVGRPRPQNVRVEFDAKMWRKPGQAPMEATSVQYNFFGRPARLFLMRARMFGLPVRALHLYRHEQATFRVRVASLVNIVNQQGEQISAAETVTVLNDLCVMAPGALVDPRLSWRPIDDRNAVVTFSNGPTASPPPWSSTRMTSSSTSSPTTDPTRAPARSSRDAGIPRFPATRRSTAGDSPPGAARSTRIRTAPSPTVHSSFARSPTTSLRPPRRDPARAGGSRVTS